ncbi:integrase [Rhodococcus pyridinivorans]|uniref:integrase n=1 Tax=Rhodococcus pyridinivorans TaxID=103816 RepID=UPI001E42BE47|nr:integrase [Rhodococcus pyridinivorans]MCD5422480.1 integrase [Rhodococcus pyridinivorans]
MCTECGRTIAGGVASLCNRCWQRSPRRPFIRAEHLMEELDDPPYWLWDFTIHVSDRHCPARAALLLTRLGALLRADPGADPQSLLDRSCTPGRSIGTLACALEDFFVGRGLAHSSGRSQVLAAGRRARRIEATPAPLRGAVAAYEHALLTERDRARRAGTRPHADNTVERRLAQARDLAVHLHERGIDDWAQVDRNCIEAYLAGTDSSDTSRLGGLRRFFRFARRSKLVLIDPTDGIRAPRIRGFRGRTEPRVRQRALFTRWTGDGTAAPDEALIGLLALIHGASPEELRNLTITDVDSVCSRVRLGRRPRPTELDPATSSALTNYLDHRMRLGTKNTHLFVTRTTRSRQMPVSQYYLSHVLDPADTRISVLRATRLLALTNTHDPNLVATTYGLSPQSILDYTADCVAPTLLANL